MEIKPTCYRETCPHMMNNKCMSNYGTCGGNRIKSKPKNKQNKEKKEN